MSDASTDDLIAQAAAACLVNRVDLTVANDLRTVRDGRHTLHLVRSGHDPRTIGPEGSIADRLVDLAFAWAREKRSQS